MSTLDDMDKDSNEKTISCPSVTRNRKVWRHSEARLMGKWAHSEAEIPGKYLPDYCNGFLYVFSPTVGLALAEAALILGQDVHPTRNDEDYVVTGLLAQRLHWVKHRSLAPIGGKSWDTFFSHCPFFDVLRYSFNPITVGAGMQFGHLGITYFLIVICLMFSTTLSTLWVLVCSMFGVLISYYVYSLSMFVISNFLQWGCTGTLQ